MRPARLVHSVANEIMTSAADTLPLASSDADSSAGGLAGSTAGASKPKARRRAPMIFGALLVAAAGAATFTYMAQKGTETTDDAQVEAHVANVAPRVTGQVKRVLVKDNQVVQAGEVVVELDDRDIAARLAAARADNAAAKAQLHAMQTQLALTQKTVDSNLVMAKGGISQASAVRGNTKATIEQSEADLAAARSRRALAALDFERSDKLFSTGAVARAEYDSKKALLDQADAAVAQAQARIASARSGVDNSVGTYQTARGRLIAAESGPEQIDASRAQVELAQARLDQTAAALEQAELNLSYTKVKAETAGVVARRSVEIGQIVAPERPLMAIVPLDDTWVVANFKEDQIADMKPGEAAKVSIDTFSGTKLSGHVESLAGGTGARFSLLPPDNASGNFTKVVQRVPVLIRLDPHPGVELRPGLSATATVYTR
jgi:membrane fusion protein (multidrug efflux system)